MSDRIRRARSIAAGAVGVGLLGTVPTLGWWTFLLFGVAVVNLVTLDWRIRRSRRPERVIAGSLVTMSLVIAAGALLTGGAHSPVLFWLIIPAAMTAARFRARVVVVGGILTAAEMVVVSLAVDPSRAAADPDMLIASLVLLVGVIAATIALMGAEMQYRGESVLDPLTGLLNRSGLESRFAELAEQARLLEKPLCLLALDLDGFKAVNDTYGHERGDAVLRDCAYVMRKALRSFELFYRLGGEEFVVLLPGLDSGGGFDVAERIRQTVAAAEPGGVKITLSAGVSAGEGDELDYEALFRCADHALYRAKREGRNRAVASAETGAPGPGSPRAPVVPQPA